MDLDQVHVGTSGWSYTGWKDNFYAGVPRKRWLIHYAEHFDSVELNGTFYRLQRESTFEKWKEQTPSTFLFTMKGHRFATHNKSLLAPDETIPVSRDNALALRDRLEVVVWQLPHKMKRDLPRFERFARTLAEQWCWVRHAFEFRHASWFDAEVAACMARYDIINCISDCPSWPMWEQTTSDAVYVRLHGHAEAYTSKYDDRVLREWVERIHQWRDEDRTVYVYFDNDAHGHAPWDALRLRELLGYESSPGSHRGSPIASQ